MFTRLSGVLADAVVGLLAAGLCAGLLVPALGAHGGPALALCLAVAGAATAIAIGQWLRRRRRDDRP